jgi:hypothetical protein
MVDASDDGDDFDWAVDGWDVDQNEDGDDDDDDNTYHTVLGFLFMFRLVLLLMTPLMWLVTPRNPSVFDQRLNWADYVTKHENRPFIRRHLRMPLVSFNKLLSYIREDLEVNQEMAARRGGAIIPEICLFCTLRWLAGGSYLDIYHFTGISRPSFYRVVWKTIKAIVRCPQLKIKFPTTAQECREAAMKFRNISTGHAIKNCVTVVDGYLLRMTTPSKKEAKNVRSFFSGHYQCHGVNIQAGCDADCRYTYVALAAPGVTADRDSLEACGFFDIIEALPVGYVTIGDAAYRPTERMVPMYMGEDRKIPMYDNFNFYGSQCRIRIEMAFGLMQMKWGILQRPLSIKMKNLKWLILAIACLHNFVIDERLMSSRDAPTECSYLPTQPEDENGDPIVLDALSLQYPGWSEIREIMAKNVAKLHLTRPPGNRIPR